MISCKHVTTYFFREDFACSVCSNLNVSVAYRNTAGVGIDEV